jgi:hypothetical protein
LPFRFARTAGLALTMSALVPLAARAQSLDGQPFRTLSADALELGLHSLEVGAEWRSSIVPVPLLSAAGGDLVQAPELRYRIGFGRAEVQVTWPARQWFSPDSPVLSHSEEVGDASFLVTIEALVQRERRPAFAVVLGTKLNNASDDSGLGTDETDVLIALALSHAGPKHDLRFNVGTAILGDPLTNSSQEDLLSWGLAARLGGRHALLAELWGLRDTSEDPRELDEATARLGYGFFRERTTVSVSALHGLHAVSGDLGVEVGVGWLLGTAR